MTRFTTSPRRQKNSMPVPNWKRALNALVVALFWLMVWQLAYKSVAQEVLLVSPVHAFLRLFSLIREPKFWMAVGATCLRVVTGFLCALLAGSLLAALCARFRVAQMLTAPVMAVIRATPVASFIILALVWMATGAIPVFIAVLMVIPMVWSNVAAGIRSADPELLEMARVFRLKKRIVLKAIYFPAVYPHLIAACSTGLGFSWKSAIAAEVISLPSNAVGRQIHNARIYLETADLFAWTIAVILISLMIERLAIRLLRKISPPALAQQQEEEGEA